MTYVLPTFEFLTFLTFSLVLQRICVEVQTEADPLALSGRWPIWLKGSRVRARVLSKSCQAITLVLHGSRELCCIHGDNALRLPE